MLGSRLKIERPAVERAARMYPTNKAAAEALGISPDFFRNLCRGFDIETPHAELAGWVES